MQLFSQTFVLLFLTANVHCDVVQSTQSLALRGLQADESADEVTFGGKNEVSAAAPVAPKESPDEVTFGESKKGESSVGGAELSFVEATEDVDAGVLKVCQTCAEGCPDDKGICLVKKAHAAPKNSNVNILCTDGCQLYAYQCFPKPPKELAEKVSFDIVPKVSLAKYVCSVTNGEVKPESGTGPLDSDDIPESYKGPWDDEDTESGMVGWPESNNDKLVAFVEREKTETELYSKVATEMQKEDQEAGEQGDEAQEEQGDE